MCALPYVVARSAPIVATVVVIVTLAACVGIAKTKDEYLGDMPGYAVFCTGLSIVAISLVLTWSANSQFQLQLVGKEAGDDVGDRYAASIKTYIRIVRILGTITSYKLSRLVQARAAPATYSSESGIPTESDSFNPWDSATSATKRTFYLQAGCATLFFLAFVLYIPVGLAIIEPFERLTVQECPRNQTLELRCVLYVPLGFGG
ncbi:hypothetical protein BBJ28_00007584 [Nothophytophthora sp. Chile5]|nr:hypothetical protein BBJ28_00007584 [Nothophytophthora sp. Chile5]